MQYLLVENKEIVHLGPIDYRPRFIQSELEDLEVDYTVSPTESGYVKINDSFELFPIGSVDGPGFDPVFEALAGPFWSYKDNEAHATYNKVELDINSIKHNLKALAKKIRTAEETRGLHLVVQLKEVFVSTSREERNQFSNISLKDGEAISWKFGASGFVDIAQSDVDFINTSIKTYIQTEFDRERKYCDMIDSAKTTVELKEINELMFTKG